MTSIHDPDGTRLPIKLDSTSNGEYEPIPLDAGANLANKMAHEAAGRNAKRSGRTRRRFPGYQLRRRFDAAGIQCRQRSGRPRRRAVRSGRRKRLSTEAAADAVLQGDEFILDVQAHFVNPTGAWLDHVPGGRQARCQACRRLAARWAKARKRVPT